MPNLYKLSSNFVTKTYKAILALTISQPLANDGRHNDSEGTLSPQECNIIDGKIDDGEPVEGIFICYEAFNVLASYGDCLDGIEGNYVLDNQLEACSAIYIIEK